MYEEIDCLGSQLEHNRHHIMGIVRERNICLKQNKFSMRESILRRSIGMINVGFRASKFREKFKHYVDRIHWQHEEGSDYIDYVLLLIIFGYFLTIFCWNIIYYLV